jgi:hypothetical protein
VGFGCRVLKFSRFPYTPAFFKVRIGLLNFNVDDNITGNACRQSEDMDFVFPSLFVHLEQIIFQPGVYLYFVVGYLHVFFPP